jgi:hypothetical protein
MIELKYQILIKVDLNRKNFDLHFYQYNLSFEII